MTWGSAGNGGDSTGVWQELSSNVALMVGTPGVFVSTTTVSELLAALVLPEPSEAFEVIT